MKRGGTTEDMWERTGFPRPRARLVVSLAAVLAVTAAAIVMVGRGSGSGVGALRAPTAPSAPEHPPTIDDPRPVLSPVEHRRPKPNPIWEALDKGEPRAIVVYSLEGGSRMLAVVDADGHVRPCAPGGKRMEVGDFAAGTILFLDDGDLFTVPATCDRAPRVLVRASDVGISDLREDWERIACPNIAPDGKRYVFSLNRRESQGPALWEGSLAGGAPVARGKVPACGWLDDRHVLAMDSDLVDTYAIPIDGGRPSLLREPWWWQGSISPRGNRSLYRIGDDVVVASRRHQDSLSVKPHFWECVDGSSSGNGVGGGMAHFSNAFRGSRWDPTGTRVLVSDEGTRREGPEKSRVWILDTMGKRLDRVMIPWCETVSWFGPRRLLVADHAHYGVLRIFELSSRRFRTIKLPGVPAKRSWENAPPFMIERPLRAPRPAAPFLPASDMRTVTLDRLDIAVDLPPSWDQTSCHGHCDIGPYNTVRQIEGWQGHWGAHTTGIPIRLAKTDDSPERARERLLARWDSRPSCHGEDECVDIKVDRSVRIGGREFTLLEIQFYEWFKTWMIGPVGDGSLVMEMPARFYRMDLTVRRAIRSIRFLDA